LSEKILASHLQNDPKAWIKGLCSMRAYPCSVQAITMMHGYKQAFFLPKPGGFTLPATDLKNAD